MSLIDTRPGYFSPRTDLSSRQNPNKSLSGLLFHLLGEEVSGQSFAKHLASLSPEQHQLLETKTGGHLPQFRSLARETKSDVFARELLQLGLLLQGDGHGELAGRIYHSLGGGDEAFAGIGDAALREQARQCLEHLKRGSLGSDMGATFRSVVHGSTDLPAVLTMGALGPVFRLTRAVTFARLAGAETVTLFTQGVGLRAAAYLSGFMAESLVYTASSEIAGAVSGNAPDSNLSFFGKWAGGAMMLGGLKAVPALLGLGASWAGSASIGGRLAQMVAPSVGQVSGMLLGNGLQAVAGLRELGSGAAEITDAVTGALHCYVGGHIIGRRFGFMEAMEKGVELQVAQLEASRLPKISPSGAFGRDLAYAGAALQSVSNGDSPKSPQEPRGSGVLMSALEGRDSDVPESGVATVLPAGVMEGYAVRRAAPAGSPRSASSPRQLRKPTQPKPSPVSSKTPPAQLIMSEGSRDFQIACEILTKLGVQSLRERALADLVLVTLHDVFLKLSGREFEELASIIVRKLEFFFEVGKPGRKFLQEILPKFPTGVRFRLAEEIAVYMCEGKPLQISAHDVLADAILAVRPALVERQKPKIPEIPPQVSTQGFQIARRIMADLPNWGDSGLRVKLDVVGRLLLGLSREERGKLAVSTEDNAVSIENNLEIIFRAGTSGRNFIKKVFSTELPYDARFKLLQGIAVCLASDHSPWRRTAYEILKTNIPRMHNTYLKNLERTLLQSALVQLGLELGEDRNERRVEWFDLTQLDLEFGEVRNKRWVEWFEIKKVIVASLASNQALKSRLLPTENLSLLSPDDPVLLEFRFRRLLELRFRRRRFSQLRMVLDEVRQRDAEAQLRQEIANLMDSNQTPETAPPKLEQDDQRSQIQSNFFPIPPRRLPCESGCQQVVSVGTLFLHRRPRSGENRREK